MNENDKNGLIRGAIILVAAIFTLLTIATCAGLWNAATKCEVPSFIIGCSIALFIANLASIVLYVRSEFKKDEKKDE